MSIEPIRVPIILDLVASGFGEKGYPIEVGIALPSGERFCRLIKPHPNWLHWDKEAETLHGISRSLLTRKGVDVQQICFELNQLPALANENRRRASNDVALIQMTFEITQQVTTGNLN